MIAKNPSAHQLQELTDTNLIGLRLKLPKSRKLQQNFAVLKPINPIGIRLFIHGRELFTRDAAQRYFASRNHADFSYADFGEAAKQKIRRLLSPKSLDERLNDYALPDDEVAAEHHRLARLKARFPHFDPPELPALSKGNARAAHEKISRAMEEHGLDPDLQEENEFLQKACRDAAEKKLAGAITQLKTQHREPLAHHFERPLLDYLAAHGWDPEIPANFLAGIKAVPHPLEAPLEDILAQGIEARTEKLLHRAASQMANPYEYFFADWEDHVGGKLLSQVHSRVLRNALRTHTAILFSNGPNMSVFHDVVGYSRNTWKGATGGYFEHRPAARTHNFILLSDDLSPLVTCHEFEHQRDLTQERPFTSRYADSLPADIVLDGIHLKAIKKFVEEFNPDSCNPADREMLLTLAKKVRHVPADIDASSAPPSLLHAAHALVAFHVNVVYSHCMAFFEPDTESVYYGSRRAQRQEVPAVLAGLKGLYPAAFLRELLPNLYERFIEHRLENPGLSDSGKSFHLG